MCDKTGDQRMFCPEDGLRRTMKLNLGCALAQAPGRLKFRDLGGKERLLTSLANKHLISIGQWGQNSSVNHL